MHHMVEYVFGIGKSQIEKMDSLRRKYPFLKEIIEQQTYGLFYIEEAVLDESVLLDKCHDHGSEGPEAFDEQVYYVSGGKARELTHGDPSPNVREGLSSRGITLDILVRVRHQKYEIDGEHRHDVSLTVFRV